MTKETQFHSKIAQKIRLRNSLEPKSCYLQKTGKFCWKEAILLTCGAKMAIVRKTFFFTEMIAKHIPLIIESWKKFNSGDFEASCCSIIEFCKRNAKKKPIMTSFLIQTLIQSSMNVCTKVKNHSWCLMMIIIMIMMKIVIISKLSASEFK